MTEPLKDTLASSLVLRDELEAMVLKELLGPAGGAGEEIEESPSTRYFVGALAPRKKGQDGAVTRHRRSRDRPVHTRSRGG